MLLGGRYDEGSGQSVNAKDKRRTNLTNSCDPANDGGPFSGIWG